MEADFLTGLDTVAEILSLQHLLQSDAGVELEDLLVGHFPEPVAVVDDLGLGFVEDFEGLIGVGCGVGQDLLTGEGRAGGGAAGWIADCGSDISD